MSMTQNKSGWIVHTPGDFPADGNSFVEAELANGGLSIGYAKYLDWGESGSDTITRYRVLASILDAYAPPVPTTAMTMRDQFAMAALPALIAAGSWFDSTGTASKAYRVADAMLTARKGGAE